jgi:hypothetical protein
VISVMGGGGSGYGSGSALSRTSSRSVDGGNLDVGEVEPSLAVKVLRGEWHCDFAWLRTVVECLVIRIELLNR